MPVDQFYEYLECIDAIEAREKINAIECREYSAHMKQKDRSKHLNKLSKTAYPISDETYITTEQFFKNMSV